jgi:aminopeptidase N
MRLQLHTLALAIACLPLTALAEPSRSSATPFSFDAAPGRLPKNVVPIDYSVAILPDAAKLTIEGTEKVTLEFREATATIVFNSLNQTLGSVRLDGVAVKSVVSSDEKQLTTVTLARPAPKGRHVLSFAYRGKIESGPQGLFAQHFVKPDGSKDVLLSTQFEATDARRMFPCWDEPAFRATFELSVTVPAGWDALSNMPVARRVVKGKLATTTFGRTPKMPSYLVEFTAGTLGSVSAESGGVKFGVWAVRGQEQGGTAALADAQQILADYNDYFGVPYPLPKLDSIAIPGGEGGAMENWGAITYNDQNLLLTPSSTLGDRQRVFSIQAHEMAHQWNGDLVTMGWWDDLWLNESFASWRAAKETDARHPEWNWWEAEDGSKEDAMRADARLSSHGIEQHVTNELEATNAFDPQITYNKGQAVLRMFEAHLGETRFRDGIRLYMKAHAYSNATSADLWAGMNAATGIDVGSIAGAWTSQPGFPVVTATAHCDAAGLRTVALTQKRFLLRGDDPDNLRWQVPLQMRIGIQATRQPVLLAREGQTLAAGRCDEPLSLNASAIGFYRVAYDDATLAVNTREFSALPSGDRIALLDDEWALVQAGMQALPSYLALVGAMGSDLNERAWSQITDAMGTIELALRGSPTHDAFAAYARSVLQPLATKLGWDPRADETPGTQKLRRRVLADLGIWGDPATLAEARKRFAGFVADRASIRPDDQAFMLRIVARHADAATFDQLHAIARSTKKESEFGRYLEALTQVGDPELAIKVGQIALSPEIPTQAARLRANLVMGLASQHPALSWKLFTENVDTLKAPMQPFGDFMVAQLAPEKYWNAEPLDVLEAWVRSHVPADMAPNIARGMEGARFKLSEQQALVKATDAYLAASAAHRAK